MVFSKIGSIFKNTLPKNDERKQVKLFCNLVKIT